MHMPWKRFLAATAGALLFICAASPAWAHPPTPPSDACSLLTQAQVSAVLGVSVGAGQRLVSTSPLLCGWEQPGGSIANSKRVVVAIIKIDQFTHEKTPLPGIIETSASGLGDEAHYMTTPGFGTGLSVKKGSFAFKVRVYGYSLDQTKAMEKTLAQDVLAKL
jgi:hypothetical protein